MNTESLSWRAYVDALKREDEWWRLHRNPPASVFGTSDTDVSWERCIKDGNAVVKLPDWDKLTSLQGDVLIGEGRRVSAYMFLGHNTAAGTANHMLHDDDGAQDRRKIHLHLRSLLRVSPMDFPGAAEEALGRITDISGIGIAVATRLLVFARPDCAVSLNGASRSGLADHSGLARSTLTKPSNYRRLLEWVLRQEWHREPRPADPVEIKIWDLRSALLDALVYDKSGSMRVDGRRSRRGKTAKPVSNPIKELTPAAYDVSGAVRRFLAESTGAVVDLLQRELPGIGGKSWWHECVLNQLTDVQRRNLREPSTQVFDTFDLAALLRVIDRNWFELSTSARFTPDSRSYLKELQQIRNRWSHQDAKGPPLEDTYRDLDTLARFLIAIRGPERLIGEVKETRKIVGRLLHS